jgi:hypothetical protein
MSRNSKNARNLAKAREITVLHKNGGKGPAKTAPQHGKKKAWWQLGSHSDFVRGSKKSKSSEAEV